MLCSCVLIYRSLYGCLLATCSECENHFGEIGVSESVLRRDWGIQVMQKLMVWVLAAKLILLASPGVFAQQPGPMSLEKTFLFSEFTLELLNQESFLVAAAMSDSDVLISPYKKELLTHREHALSVTRAGVSNLFFELSEWRLDPYFANILNELVEAGGTYTALTEEINRGNRTAFMARPIGEIYTVTSQEFNQAISAYSVALIKLQRFLLSSEFVNNEELELLKIRHELGILQVFFYREASALTRNIIEGSIISKQQEAAAKNDRAQALAAWKKLQEITTKAPYKNAFSPYLETTQKRLIDTLFQSSNTFYEVSNTAFGAAHSTDTKNQVNYGKTFEDWYNLVDSASSSCSTIKSLSMELTRGLK